MASSDTKALIAQAIEQLGQEVPALNRLKLVMKLELPARGGQAPIWRVELPGRTISRDPAADSRVHVSVARQDFNELARDGRLAPWVEAYERGHVRVSGDPAVVNLLGNVIRRRIASTHG